MQNINNKVHISEITYAKPSQTNLQCQPPHVLASYGGGSTQRQLVTVYWTPPKAKIKIINQ